MAFQAKDGKSFTNRPAMMAHNRSVARMGAKSEAGGAGMEKADPLEQPGSEMEDGEQDGEAIASEHGPAHEVHMQHDHEAGMHRVHSMHPDGHEHHSDHASVEDAHEHGKKLAGAGHEEPAGDEHEEEPEYE
jgi:hypothetical protein